MGGHHVAGVGGRPRRHGVWQEIIFNQEMARFDVTSGFLAATIGMVGALLSRTAATNSGRATCAGCCGATMRGASSSASRAPGSDLANLSARADRDGDDFVVNGQKVWNSNAHLCDWGILIARTNFDAPKHRGITFFIVDMHTPGIEPRPLRQITGHTHFTEVFLTDVRIPAAQRRRRRSTAVGARRAPCSPAKRR